MGNTALRCCQSPALGPGSGEVSPLAWPTGQEGSFHCRVPLFLAKGCEVGVSWNESRGPGAQGTREAHLSSPLGPFRPRGVLRGAAGMQKALIHRALHPSLPLAMVGVVPSGLVFPLDSSR